MASDCEKNEENGNSLFYYATQCSIMFLMLVYYETLNEATQEFKDAGNFDTRNFPYDKSTRNFPYDKRHFRSLVVDKLNH